MDHLPIRWCWLSWRKEGDSVKLMLNATCSDNMFISKLIPATQVARGGQKNEVQHKKQLRMVTLRACSCTWTYQSKESTGKGTPRTKLQQVVSARHIYQYLKHGKKHEVEEQATLSATAEKSMLLIALKKSRQSHNQFSLTQPHQTWWLLSVFPFSM